MNTGHIPAKELRRTREGRIIAGVCSGAARFLGIDANILRLALAVASFFGGIGVGIYAVAWLLIPEEGRQGSILQDLINKQQSDPNSTWHQASSHWRQPADGQHSAEQRPYAGPPPAYPPQTPQTPQDRPQDQPGGARPQSPTDEPPTTI
ncbi:hypothetical protein Sru01_24310 [Sphaerisporangium rufum]|uniref:Phage shock protein PspC N-terminal domain-containing protein n=2 Tax=Sphaerisporangium rufum TaxID=1381558 RepID=A0A919R0K8_9ACTN|nr:hypothetical protein Sru01_24310 [Sphaerisporangium rufum]